MKESALRRLLLYGNKYKEKFDTIGNQRQLDTSIVSLDVN